MPGLNGMQVARMAGLTRIVFVTAHDEYAVSALLALLAPPSSAARLDWLTVRLADTTRIVAVDEVLYFRSTDKYTEAVTATDRHLVRTPLKELLAQLDPKRFSQVHRSIVINMGAVDRIERDVLGRSQIYLRNHPDVLPVSRSFAEQFKHM
jgi:DNA-binding LytR/AlgR family response regulator